MKFYFTRFSHRLAALILGGVIGVGLLIQHFRAPAEPVTFSRAEFNRQLPAKYRKAQRGPDQRPSEWAWLQRIFPYYNADKMAYHAAIQQAQALRHQSLPTGAKYKPHRLLREQNWDFAGPNNIGGRVSDIEYNPQHPEIVYAGAATGGVFKSTDGGLTWQPVFDTQPNLSVGDIAVDPQQSQIVYVGTGEANGGHNNFPGAGIFKTTDGGDTWQLMGLERTISIGRIVIDPFNPQRIFVAAAGSYFGPDPDRGVYASINGGQTWEKSLFINDSTGVIDIIMHPQNPQLLLAAAWERVRRAHTSHLYGYSSGIYRSENGGRTWQRLGARHGLPENEEQIGRIGLALCQSQPNVMYALYTDGVEYLAAYRSLNQGLNWQLIDPDREIAAGTGTFCWYFGNIRVHPQDPLRVFALDVAFMQSYDGGANWPIIYGYGNPDSDFHVDHHALAFHPVHPDTMLEGNDGGINITYNGGVSWKKVKFLPFTQFYEITMDFTHPERLYGGTQDNGTLRTLTGRVDDWEAIYGGDGFYPLVDPSNSNIIYAESQFGYLGKSTDGGRYFSTVLTGINSSEPTNWSTPVVMDPKTPTVLYYGTDRVYQTVNGARTWRAISPDLTKNLADSRLGTVTTIAVAPSNAAVIYAGTDDGNVWLTTNTGLNWKQINQGLPYRWVTRLAVDPTNYKIAYVTFSGLKWKSPQAHVFQTQNAGDTWTDISHNLPDAPVNAIVVDPIYPNNLFVGTDVGCYFSSDYGANWDVLGNGIPIVPVYSLIIHPKQRLLAIGTHGRSMYTLSIQNFYPVELATFTATLTEKGARLHWRTATETNNWGFYVEKRLPPAAFQTLGFIKGAGTSAAPQDYTYLDPNLMAGLTEYRLRQVDLDGKFDYSEIVTLEMAAPEQFALHANFPNPFNANTTISFQVREKTWLTLRIYNAQGQLVHTLLAAEKLPGNYQVPWSGVADHGQNVASGVYYCQMLAPGFKQVQRLILLK